MKRKLWKAFEIFGIVLGVVLGLEQVASKVGWLPGYRIERIPLSSITPKYDLFPGQYIKLKSDFQERVSDDQIESADWEIQSPSKEKIKESGLRPTIRIPAEGGLYSIKIDAKLLSEKSSRTGHGTFYVVQDRPIFKRVEEGETSRVDSDPKSDQIAAVAESKELEVFAGENGWQELSGATIQDGKVIFNHAAEVPTFLGKVLFRAKGSEARSSDYGTLELKASKRD